MSEPSEKSKIIVAVLTYQWAPETAPDDILEYVREISKRSRELKRAGVKPFDAAQQSRAEWLEKFQSD